jgi:Nucleotidyl transferase AbiEii toxin, Type IV TA system
VATLIGESPLTIREFLMRELLPLGTIHDAILEFVRDRDDAVLFGAQVVNLSLDVPRLTQDVDLASTRAPELAEELRSHLNQRFGIAVRVRDVRQGLGFRIDQVRQEGNRHLVDIRPVPQLPPSHRIEGFLVVTPEGAIAGKLAAWVGRQGKPKAGTDWRDLAMLLLRFPELKRESGPVRDRLLAVGAGEEVLRAWRDLVAQEITPEQDEDEFDY